MVIYVHGGGSTNNEVSSATRWLAAYSPAGPSAAVLPGELQADHRAVQRFICRKVLGPVVCRDSNGDGRVD